MGVFDFKVLKAVGSHTRMKILGRLRSGHMTLSDLAGHFGMHPSSVKEHLDLLVGAGLIRIEDDGRKWKYYGLTPAGAGMFDAGELKVSLPALGGLVFLVLSAGSWQPFAGSGAVVQKTAEASAAQGMLAARAVSETVAAPAPAVMPQFPLVLAAAGILLLSLAAFNWRRNRRKGKR